MHQWVFYTTDYNILKFTVFWNITILCNADIENFHNFDHIFYTFDIVFLKESAIIMLISSDHFNGFGNSFQATEVDENQCKC
jgi:hypothetical protein